MARTKAAARKSADSPADGVAQKRARKTVKAAPAVSEPKAKKPEAKAVEQKAAEEPKPAEEKPKKKKKAEQKPAEEAPEEEDREAEESDSGEEKGESPEERPEGESPDDEKGEAKKKRRVSPRVVEERRRRRMKDRATRLLKYAGLARAVQRIVHSLPNQGPRPNTISTGALMLTRDLVEQYIHDIARAACKVMQANPVDKDKPRKRLNESHVELVADLLHLDAAYNPVINELVAIEDVKSGSTETTPGTGASTPAAPPKAKKRKAGDGAPRAAKKAKAAEATVEVASEEQ